eukprot:ANDGO_04223.mRNA.1 Transmembrane protein 260 homolog
MSGIILWSFRISIFVGFLCLYVKTLYASVPPGDSGEIILVAHHLGVAHPPGYPTFTLLSHISINVLGHFFPDSSVAWRVNAFNALCGALAALGLFEAALAITKSPLAAMYAGAMWAASPIVWQYAITAEVFSLNNLFATWLIVFALWFDDHPSQRRLLASAFVSGLAMTNQHTIALFQIPLIAWAGWRAFRTGILSVKLVLQAAAAYVAGLLPYAYLVAASFRKPSFTWGDSRTLPGFVRHVLRQEYGTFDLAPYQPDETVLGRIGTGVAKYIGEFATNESLPVVGLILSVAGLLVLWRLRKDAPQEAVNTVSTSPRRDDAERKKPALKKVQPRKTPLVADRWSIGPMLCASWVFYTVFFHWRANLSLENNLYRGVSMRFWQQPNVILFLSQAVGLHFAVHRLFSKAGASSAKMILSLVVIAAISWQIQRSFAALDESRNSFTEMFGRAILRPLPPNSILLTKGDLMVNSARYVLGSEGFQAGNVTIIDQEMFTYPWYLEMHGDEWRSRGIVFPGTHYHVRGKGHFNMKTFLDANYEKFKIFIAGGWKDGDPSPEPSYFLLPHGLTWRVIRDFEKIQASKNYKDRFFSWCAVGWNALPRPDELPDVIHKYTPESWEAVIHNDILESHVRWSVHFLTELVQHPEWTGTEIDAWLHSTVRIYEFYEKNASPEIDIAFIFRNRGVAYLEGFKRHPSNANLAISGSQDYKEFIKRAQLSLKRMRNPAERKETEESIEVVKVAITQIDAHLEKTRRHPV